MLRQATIHATKPDRKAVRLTVLHDTIENSDGGFIAIQINSGQQITVNAEDLREAIADVLPKEAA